VLYGRGGGAHANLANSTKRLLVVQIVSIGVILASVWFVRYGRLWWWILAAFAAIAYFSAVIARRRAGRRGGMAQVRLNAAGFVQDDCPEDGPNTGPLRMVAELFILMLPSSFSMVGGPSRAIFQIIWPAAVVLVLTQRFILPIPAAARSRRIVAGLPGGRALMPAWRGWWTPAPAPWSAVHQARVEPLIKPSAEVTHELVVHATAPWWRPSDREPVHLQFRCAREQASELAGRIVAWREFARQDQRLGVKKT
jgi:hypothetical protein